MKISPYYYYYYYYYYLNLLKKRDHHYHCFHGSNINCTQRAVIRQNILTVWQGKWWYTSFCTTKASKVTHFRTIVAFFVIRWTWIGVWITSSTMKTRFLMAIIVYWLLTLLNRKWFVTGKLFVCCVAFCNTINFLFLSQLFYETSLCTGIF